MSGVALLAATLLVLIMNYALSLTPFPVPTQFSVLFFLVSLFMGVLVYHGLSK
ncbi:hypothetical protein [Halorubrum ezzemoulense]|uniref:hypothetical protein n=1 Tax=Halorubrum ezzemoulense TaxID=337243 RepID=UPI00232AD465|nr:hypothetical protein [Halorubrum ezzemoulense]MDB2241847.1 hypothetical protein [Halorubrum ezzemoulense]MDB2283056.1 hypothetical protein [Halorubrum ezzemoulense]MDB9253409.1 hypothetical protein [Halorubrum ezzemoulense]MDB9254285.1 hypothetical protein [Halorubrum ezzemoulense]MDB9274996.1 hypothetical protein [Halorubrum ezzemoulense]